MNDYLQLIRFDKPIGTFLLLWPTYWALWLASNGAVQMYELSLFFLGTFIMRSAGCVINDFFDRKIDIHIERTKSRPLASGRIAPSRALIFFLFLMLIAAIIAAMLGIEVFRFALIGACLTIIYPLCKRFLRAPQAVLGLAFAWGVPMAYVYYHGFVPFEGWVLYLVTFFWIVAYDTAYALVDIEDDLKVGINSTAILFGKYANITMMALMVLFLLGLSYVGYLNELEHFYYALIAIASIFLIYLQNQFAQKKRSAYFKSFKAHGYYGAFILFSIILAI